MQTETKPRWAYYKHISGLSQQCTEDNHIDEIPGWRRVGRLEWFLEDFSMSIRQKLGILWYSL